MYIGLISDSHGVFDDRFRSFLDPVDELWHAGDWGGDAEFVDSIASYKPVVGVYGNCDGSPVRYQYPKAANFEREGVKVLMTHIGGSPGHYDPFAREMIEKYRPDIFVCGHSHILKVMRDKRYDLLYVNPGACGILGWQLVRTALRFKLSGGKVSDMEVFELQK